MHLMLRFKDQYYISNALSTLSGQMSPEHRFGLSVSPMGILHGLSPDWRRLQTLILLNNYHKQATGDSQTPLCPFTADYTASMVMFTDNTAKEIAVTFSEPERRVSPIYNSYPVRIRERIISPYIRGQVFIGNWQPYDPGFNKNVIDRNYSIIADGCKSAEEFFIRTSYFCSPNFGSYHRFEAIDLMKLSHRLLAKLEETEIKKKLKECIDNGAWGDILKEADMENQALEIFLGSRYSTFQTWLDDELAKIAVPLDELL